MLFNPRNESFEHLDARSREIMAKTIAFFETKGKAQLKEDDHDRRWYADFLEFVKENQVFATLLTPPEFAGDNPDARWDTYRNCDFNEILGFYGLAYWYTWQVTILGLGPIWMSPNNGFGRRPGSSSQKGASSPSGCPRRPTGRTSTPSEMTLTPLGDGSYVADGGKYYIGNGNEAALRLHLRQELRNRTTMSCLPSKPRTTISSW